MRSAAVLAIWTATAHAGPPYVTDDPEPVAYRHWEIYLATQHALAADDVSGTAPHVEVNYGVWHEMQLHVLAPLAYDHPAHAPTTYRPGDLELGVKVRFVDEHGRRPMIGTFPLVLVPTGGALGTGHVHAFVPLWIQASSGPWTTYGGGGYWINPGTGNRDFVLLGWQAQRRLSERATVGAEVFYTTADHAGGRGNLRFDLGIVLDLADEHHLLFSMGRSIAGETRFQGYLAYLVTL